MGCCVWKRQCLGLPKPPRSKRMIALLWRQKAADIGEFSGLTWESSGHAGLSSRGYEGQAQAVETVRKATGNHGRVGTTE